MSPTPIKMNPFPGLRPFTQEEDYLFFGREEQTIELLQRLGGNRFLAVVGTSGSGKSSLVRCGLLSELLGGKMLDAGASWEVAVTHPGGNPLAHLTEALLEVDLYDRDTEHARENLLATLSRSQFGLVEAVKQADQGEATNFLLVVDQFEEIFRFREAGQWQQEAANEFVSLLLEATAQKEVPIYVVLTMRSDFIGECSQFEGLAEMVNRGEFLIPRLTREQYKRVIEGPIRVAGGQIEPRLMQRLLNDLGQQADQLPCLQHALMRSWAVWAAKGDTEALDLDDYQRVGKMSQALSLHADEIYESLAGDRQRAMCQRMFQALTVEEANNRGIRRPQRLGRLCQILEVQADELKPIIDAYRHSGVTFLMPSHEVELTDQTIIDISHESLMRVWTRLRQWVEEETQAVGIYRRLSESADLHDQGKAGMYRDPELGIALAWRDSKRPNAAWAERYRPGFGPAMTFLETSHEAAEREKKEREAARQRELDRARQLAETQASVARLFKRFAGGLAVGLCLAVALTIWAFMLRQEAKWQEATAQKFAEESKIQSKLAIDNATKAETEARAARTAEQKAKDRATAEAEAKALAQLETQRAEAEKKRAESLLTRAERLVYVGKLMLAQSDFEADKGGLALRYLNECKVELRGWEHRYLWTRVNAKQTLLGHTGMMVSVVAFSPDGQRIVTGSWDNTAKLWDAENGQERITLKGHTDHVLSVAFSPDGKRIVTGSSDNLAKVWDAATGQELFALKGHSLWVQSVAFSPDGKRIVTGAGEWNGAMPGQVKVWDAGTGEILLALEGHTLAVHSVAFSPDGQHIISGSSDNTVKVWDALKGQERLTLKGHMGQVDSVAFSPDGKRIVTGSWDNTAKVWDATTGQELFTLKGHTLWVHSVAFSPDGKRIVSGGGEWNGPGEVKVWDAVKGQEVFALKGHGRQVRSVAFSPDGQRIVTSSSDNTAKVWDAEKGQEIIAVRHVGAGAVWCMAFSPNSKRIVTGNEHGIMRVLDAATGQELLVVRYGAPDKLTSVAYSPNGNHIVIGNMSGMVKVLDAATGRERLALKGAAGIATFSPDGQRIVTGSSDGTAKVWDVENGQEVLTLKGHIGGVSSAAFSLDGKRIVTACADGTGKVWDAANGLELLTLNGTGGNAAFSPDGKRIVTGNMENTAKVWDAATGQELLTLKGHAGAVTGVVFSPDGQRIVTGSQDMTAKVWEAETGQELFTLKRHKNEVLSVAFSPDGQRIATGTANADNTTRIWYAENRQEVDDNAWPLPNATEQKTFHTEQATLAEREKQWFAAEFHLRLVLRDDPENSAVRKRLAQIAFVIPFKTAYDQKKFTAAIRLWAEALETDPKIGDSRQTQHRYNAACAAAMAAAGQGKDEPPLDDAAKAKLRRLALDLLKAELIVWDILIDTEPPKDQPFIAQTLSHWLNDPDLIGIHGEAALAKLPVEEQEAFNQLWAAVARVLKKAEEKPK